MLPKDAPQGVTLNETEVDTGHDNQKQNLPSRRNSKIQGPKIKVSCMW